MSDSVAKDFSISRYVLEDIPSTPSTPSIDSVKSSSSVSTIRQIGFPLVTPPGTNIQQASSALSSLLAVNLQNKALVTGRSEPIHPFATSPRPITLRSSPSKPTPPILAFPQANSPPAYSRAITYSPGIFSRDYHLRTGLSETDNQRSSQQPMAPYPSQHLYRTHPSDVHSIFLRAFHSPWSGIGRRLALAIRGFVSLYMTITFLMVVAWHAKTEGGMSVVMFKFETISYLWQVAYSWVTFVSLP